jgi:dethiobiotin synthetase
MRMFVTGTGTGVGKTYVSVALLEWFKRHKIKAMGIKLLASGCQEIEGRLFNDDALLLRQHSHRCYDYERHNPFAFSLPIAPHLAAKEVGVSLSAKCLCEAARSLPDEHAVTLYEGVGGWYVPLNNYETMAHVVQQLSCSVIMVVNVSLGCLNHALLTYKAICDSGLSCVGWVANQLEADVLYAQENYETLSHWINAPCLGFVRPGMQAIDGLDSDVIKAMIS